VAVYCACFRDYRDVLAAGEVGTVAIVAADRKQARTILRYITGFLDSVPMLAKLVESRTAETITLQNRIVIEVHTASWRTLRGYTLVAAVCDEIAFWRTDDSANPDREILSGLRPSMATVPGRAVALHFLALRAQGRAL
jgi:phage terminase large subunit-like protein